MAVSPPPKRTPAWNRKLGGLHSRSGRFEGQKNLLCEDSNPRIVLFIAWLRNRLRNLPRVLPGRLSKTINTNAHGRRCFGRDWKGEPLEYKSTCPEGRCHSTSLFVAEFNTSCHSTSVLPSIFMAWPLVNHYIRSPCRERLRRVCK